MLQALPVGRNKRSLHYRHARADQVASLAITLCPHMFPDLFEGVAEACRGVTKFKVSP